MRIVVAMIALVAGVMFASAQDDASADCAAAPDAIEIIAEFLAEPLTPLEMLRLIYEAAQEALIACSGYTFTSEAEGMNPALGPVTLDEGLWRVSVETGGYLFLDLTVLEGDCKGTGALAVMGTLFMVMQQGDGAQTLIDSKGCDALFEFSQMSDDWTMTLEKLR